MITYIACTELCELHMIFYREDWTVDTIYCPYSILQRRLNSEWTLGAALRARLILYALNPFSRGRECQQFVPYINPDLHTYTSRVDCNTWMCSWGRRRRKEGVASTRRSWAASHGQWRGVWIWRLVPSCQAGGWQRGLYRRLTQRSWHTRVQSSVSTRVCARSLLSELCTSGL